MGLLDMSPAPTQAPFSLLGLLLGGRSYGANYFAQRDALTQAANERARVGQAAQGLLASPEYKQVFSDPDRQAAGALWAKMQPDFSAMGNNLLSQKIGSIYQTQSQQLGEQLQEKSTQFADTLERQRMGISVDDQLRMDQIKRDRDNLDAGNKLKQMLAMPGSIGLQTFLKNTTGYEPPADYYVKGLDPNTQAPQLALMPNSPTYMKATDEIAPQKDSAESIKMLSDMANGTVPYDQGQWNAVRNGVLDNISKGRGSYDDGVKDLMNQMVPDSSMTSTDWLGTKKSQLAIAAKLYAAKAQAAANKWGINLDDMPSTLRISGMSPNVPPPDTDPNAARSQILLPGTSLQHPISSRERAPGPTAAQRSSEAQGGGTRGSGGVLATGRRMWSGP